MLQIIFLLLKVLGCILLILLALLVLILTIPVGIRGEIAQRKPALYAKAGPLEIKVYPFPQKKKKKEKKPPETKREEKTRNEHLSPDTGVKKEEKPENAPDFRGKEGDLPPSLDLPKTDRSFLEKPPETGEGVAAAFRTAEKKIEKEIQGRIQKGIEQGMEKGIQDIPWAMIRRLLGMAGPIVRKLLAALRIYDLELVLPVHGRDAADTAITYGRVSALIYGTLTLVQNLCRLEARKIWLEPDFTGEQGEIEYFSCKITTHLFIIVMIILWVLFRLKWPKED